jgi:dTDP-4-amino-4,6-dideoxygalactose transaminase
MNAFREEPEALRAAMLEAAARVMASGWYVLGPEVEAFERQWSAACGLPFGVGVGNGMDAIEIGLRALGIGPGDEVITTPMTAFASVLAITRAGATPVLADIDPHTALLSMESANRCISSRTRAVLLVHLYGQVRDMSAWVEFCQGHQLHLVEDCAQAHLAQWQGRTAGAFGALGAYSFYPTKNLGALGDAGMLVMGDKAMAEKATRLRNYGQSERYLHPELGMNSRLDELQAAILSVRLRWLEDFTLRRRAIADQYRAGITNAQVQMLAPPQAEQSHVNHLFVTLCGQRQRLQDHLKSRGVQALAHYPVPIHAQQPYADVRRDPRGLPAAEHHALSCLSLPCHPQMSAADVQAVVAAVNSF